MDLDLSPVHRMVQEPARAFAQKEIVPVTRQYDEESYFPARAGTADG